MFHNSCYVVLDLDVVPNPLFHNSFNFFVIFSVNFKQFSKFIFPKMAPATFRRISTNVPGKFRFIMGFDINPGTFGRIRPKVACEIFPSVRPKIFRPSVRKFSVRPSVRNFSVRPSVRPKFFRPSVGPSEIFPSVRPKLFS